MNSIRVDSRLELPLKSTLMVDPKLQKQPSSIPPLILSDEMQNKNMILCCVIQHRIWYGAMWYSTGSDIVPCDTAQDLTLFGVIQCTWYCALSCSAEYDIVMCDTAQDLTLFCVIHAGSYTGLWDTALDPTVFCVIQHRICYCAVWYSAGSDSVVCDTVHDLIQYCAVWYTVEQNIYCQFETAQDLILFFVVKCKI
jgi:hypothetical protein